MEKLGKIYDLSPDIKFTEGPSDKNGIHGIDGILIGLDKHINETKSSEESPGNCDKSSNNYEELEKKNIEITNQKSQNIGPFPDNVSHVSHLSQIEKQVEETAEEPEQCASCGSIVTPFDKNTHPACCTGRKGRALRQEESDTQ